VQTIQQGAAKVKFRATLTDPTGKLVDLTYQASITFVFRSPTGVRAAYAGVVVGDPAVGLVQYVSAAGQFDEPGRWQVQVEVTFQDAADYHSKAGKFKVKANL
jgi:hypothetical protein